LPSPSLKLALLSRNFLKNLISPHHFSVYDDVKEKHEADSTVTYFKIAEIILPPLPALEVYYQRVSNA